MRRKLKYKYIVHPGWVQGEDQEYRFMSFPEIVRMYGVSASDCLNADSGKVGRLEWTSLTHLHPTRACLDE